MFLYVLKGLKEYRGCLGAIRFALENDTRRVERLHHTVDGIKDVDNTSLDTVHHMDMPDQPDRRQTPTCPSDRVLREVPDPHAARYSGLLSDRRPSRPPGDRVEDI